MTSGILGTTRRILIKVGSDAKFEAPLIIFQNKVSGNPTLAKTFLGWFLGLVQEGGWIRTIYLRRCAKRGQLNPWKIKGYEKIYIDDISWHNINEDIIEPGESIRTSIRYLPPNKTDKTQQLEFFDINKIDKTQQLDFFDIKNSYLAKALGFSGSPVQMHLQTVGSPKSRETSFLRI